MIGGGRIFQDRRDAGRRLAEALAHFKGEEAIVLALPRGGVPVAAEIARALDALLDILIVRKIGAPSFPEMALGAVVGGRHPQLVLNEDLIARVRPPSGYIAMVEAQERAEIERRRRAYRGEAPAPDVAGRVVILVDDGIATGASVRVALRAVRQERPSRLVLAVPVAPPESLDELAGECDEIVCLAAPEEFQAVSVHYDDFAQTSDGEVIRLLAEARQSTASDL